MSNNEDKSIESIAVAFDGLLKDLINNVVKINDDAECTQNDSQGSEDSVLKLVKESPDTANDTECTANKFEKSENLVEAEEKLLDKSTRIEVSNSNDTKEESWENKNFLELQEASDSLHSPFYWQADLRIKTYGDHEIDLLTEFDEMFEETYFTFRRFIINLIMCYHNFYKRCVDRSMKNLEQMETMLYYSARKESVDPLFTTIKDALFHITHSCRVYILETTNQIREACQILEKIKPYRSLDNSNKAGIWGVRAAVYAEYGYEGVNTAIQYASKAIEFDNKNVFWYFFKGIYLGRLRRMEKGRTIPKEEEIICLETAAQSRKHPAFYAFTAEVYLESVKGIKKREKSKKLPIDKQILSQYLEKCTIQAKKYFEESVKMKNCAHLLFRCGKGLMRLPPPYKDLKMAETLLKQGLEMSPQSSFGNHAMAIFMMKHKKDSEAAEECFEKSVERGNFQAHMDLCRMRYLESENSEFLVSELNKMLDWYKERPKICKVYGELICCYLFTDYDLMKACNCAKNLIELHTTWIDYIYEFNSSLFPFSNNIPLIKLIVSEIGGRFYRKDITHTEKNEYKKFLNFISLEGVRLSKNTPKNILRTYLDDLKQGLQKQRQFVAVKSYSKKKERHWKEKHQGTHLRSSSDKEYYKYYKNHEPRSVYNMLRSPSPSSAESDLEREQSRHKKRRDRDMSEDESERSRRNRSCQRKHDRPHGRRNRSESFSKSSVSSREHEKTEPLAESMSALAIDTCKQMKSSAPTDQISLAEKFEAVALNSKKMDCDMNISYSEEKEPQKNAGPEKVPMKFDKAPRSNQNEIKGHFLSSSIRENREKDDVRNSSSSADRKLTQSNRCKEKYRNPSPDRKSTRSDRIRKDCDPSSSPNRKVVRSDRKKSRDSPDRKSMKSNRNRKDCESSSSSSGSHFRGRKNKSKRSYEHRDHSGESRRSCKHSHSRDLNRSYSSSSESDDSRKYRNHHSRRRSRGGKSLRELSYSSDRSRRSYKKRSRREGSDSTDRSKDYGGKESYKSHRPRKSREKQNRRERSYSGEKPVRDHDGRKNCESNRSRKFREHDNSYERNDRKKYSRCRQE